MNRPVPQTAALLTLAVCLPLQGQYQNDGNIQVLGIPGFVYVQPGSSIPPPTTNLPAIGGCTFMVPLDGQVLYLPFDEDENGPVFDEGGSSTFGQAYETSVELFGAIGSAFTFDGILSKVIFTETTNFGFSYNDSFTVSAWINAAGLGHEGLGSACIVGMGDCKPGFWKLDLHYGSEGNLRLRMGEEGGTVSSTSASIPGYARDQWFHVTVTRNASNRQVRLYADGTLIKAASDTTASSWTNTLGDMQIGNFTMWPYQMGFNGMIDDLRLYRRALSAAEVSNLCTVAASPPTVGFEEWTVSNACSFTTIRRWTGTDSCSATNYEEQWLYEAFSNAVVLTCPSNLVAQTNSVPETTCCARTQGYWKNHPEDWPVTNLVAGGMPYSLDDAMEILWTPTRGDATYILAHQLIAAKLNFDYYCAGAPPDALTNIANAEAWLTAHPLGERPSGTIKTNGTELATILDEYNNGIRGPGHCGTLGISPGTGTYEVPDVIALTTVSGDTNGYSFWQVPAAGTVVDWGSITAVVVTAQDPCFNENTCVVPMYWPPCLCLDNDSDGDGVIDRDEYCAGTEVYDAGDFFGLTTITWTNSGLTEVGWAWEFGTNRSYTVQGTLYADSPFYITMATGVTAEAFSEIGFLPPACIYRILCEP